MGETIGAPVSYCSAECGSADTVSERVYLASDDGGEHWYETGRCPLAEGSFLNAGFADGRLVGLDVGRVNAARTGWCDYIAVRESTDGGSTWTETARLLEGCAVYLWRLRRLRDGSLLVLASFYGTPWGAGCERATRNTMLPGETYLNKIQTFFLHSPDGQSFSGPHYVLPGIGAHEYDAAELSDGRLLFVAGDVQGTPVGRQLVRRSAQGFINGPLLPIGAGAPPEPAKNPQGGFVPESIVCLPGDVLVGARRGKPFSCSGDLGQTWTVIEARETDSISRASACCRTDALRPSATAARTARSGRRAWRSPPICSGWTVRLPRGVSCLLNACFLRTGAITATHIRRG